MLGGSCRRTGSRAWSNQLYHCLWIDHHYAHHGLTINHLARQLGRAAGGPEAEHGLRGGARGGDQQRRLQPLQRAPRRHRLRRQGPRIVVVVAAAAAAAAVAVAGGGGGGGGVGGVGGRSSSSSSSISSSSRRRRRSRRSRSSSRSGTNIGNNINSSNINKNINVRMMRIAIIF